MLLLNSLLILSTGFLAWQYFSPNAGILERLGFLIFLSLTIVPFVNTNLAFFNSRYITNQQTLFLCALCIAFFAVLSLLKKKDAPYPREKRRLAIVKSELLAILVLIIILLFSYRYYSNDEFILSLGSYLIKGESECFYMLTFKTVGILNPGAARHGLSNDAYKILCTPGNVLFTSTLLPIFKVSTFKLVYLLFTSLLFIFVYLVNRKLIAHENISLIVAAFAVLNPYVLSVEVMDRNVMTLAISAVLLYLLLEYKDKTLIHGFVFGILAGTGLRFLPLLFFLPILILYRRQKINIRGRLWFMIAFVPAFAFNIPHLYFHGFHSLGEESSSWSLLVNALLKWQRTPFLPFSNAIFYLINIANFLGYLVCGIIILGALRLFQKSKVHFWVFSSIFLSIFFVLSYQRNWIEGDKHRIIIEAFLPLYIFLAYGLQRLLARGDAFRKYALWLCFMALTVIFAHLLSLINFPPDEEFYKKKYLYQREAKGYLALTKRFLSDVRFPPNYHRLFTKLDLKRKPVEERLTWQNVFPLSRLPNFQRFNGFYSEWKEYFLEKASAYQEILPAINAYSPQDYVYLKIDFKKLADNPPGAIETVKDTPLAAIDLEKREELSDVYYADLNVGWQGDKLPVCVLWNNSAIDYLKELDIELNAFISLGKDKDGFDIVNSVNYYFNPSPAESAYQDGLRSLPLDTEDNTITLRLPKDIRVVIKNWFVNGENGIPYKVDSWCIKQTKDGKYRAEFFYNEPESYL